MNAEFAVAERLSSRLSAWLLRPYLDLGPFTTGPLHVRRVEEHWKAFADLRSPAFVSQRALPPAFKAQLVQEADLPQHYVRDPRQLPDSLMTERWRAMCEALDNWNDLSSERQSRLILLLHSLCLYECVLEQVPRAEARALSTDPHRAELAFWRELARYIQGLPDRISEYGWADMSGFEEISCCTPSAVPAGFNAAIRVLVHNAKTGASHRELAKLAARAERALADSIDRVDTFTSVLLKSRFHRAAGFVPQRCGDRVEVCRQMDLAERYAYSVKPATAAQEVLYLENLHALMESRTKEAIWLGDNELALSRALKVTEVDPYDAKAWVELGEIRMRRKEWALAADAYVIAAMLGPPASAVGRHMAGLCFRELGHDLLAALFFKETLDFDPLGISPRDEIRALPDIAALQALKEWSRNTIKL